MPAQPAAASEASREAGTQSITEPPEPTRAPPEAPEPEPSRPTRLWLRSLFAMAVTALVMVFLFRKLAGLQASREALAAVRWSLTPWPLLLLAFTVVISVNKWRFVLRRMGYELAYGQTLRALLAAWPFAAITPSRAGDFMRCAGIRDKVPLVQGGASILIDRLFDVQSLVLLSLAGALAHGWWSLAGGLSGGLLAAWLFGLWLLAHRQRVADLPVRATLRDTLSNLITAITHIVHSKTASLKLTCYSLGNWLAVQTIFGLLLVMCGANIDLLTAFTLWPIATLVGLVPLTLSGMGTRDLAFVYLLKQTSGHSPEYGALLLATFGYSLFSAWILALVGTPFTIHMLLGSGQNKK